MATAKPVEWVRAPRVERQPLAPAKPKPKPARPKLTEPQARRLRELRAIAAAGSGMIPVSLAFDRCFNALRRAGLITRKMPATASPLFGRAVLIGLTAAGRKAIA
jgi:hypothetical protein